MKSYDREHLEVNRDIRNRDELAQKHNALHLQLLRETDALVKQSRALLTESRALLERLRDELSHG
jgi:hypothetical protein